MIRQALLLCIAAAVIQSAAAQNWPKLPRQDRVITIKEVKEYWARKLPRPIKPRSLARGYKQKVASYQRAVYSGCSHLQALKVGHHDEFATLTALHHNRDYYRRAGNQRKAEELTTEVNAILERRAAVARANQKPEAPRPPASSDTEDDEEDQRRQQEEDDEYYRQQQEEQERQRREEEEANQRPVRPCPPSEITPCPELPPPPVPCPIVPGR